MASACLANIRSLVKGPPSRRPAYLRCRIRDRIRRFFWPRLRRPLPDFLTPMLFSGRNSRKPESCKNGRLPLQAGASQREVDWAWTVFDHTRTLPTDGMIVFFPTYAKRLPGTRQWQASVAGMVARPLPERSRRRVLARAVLKRILDVDDAAIDTDIFRDRADAFFFQRLAGRPVRVAIAGRTVNAGQSDRTGHFQTDVVLDDDDLTAWANPCGTGCRWLPYEGSLAADEEIEAAGADGSPLPSGRIQCIEDEGLSVISDIDDTVKVTNVAHRRELLANTFLREFAAVPGMVEAFQRLAERGTAFHYVSASPWQLVPSLCEFFSMAGLPAGSMHLKLFRLKDSTPLGRFPSRKRSKRRAIERILADFPGRRFVLVGDSGERDPEVYAAVARRYPHQVMSVLIRQVAARAPREKVLSRIDRLARKLPEGRLRVFTEPADVL
jgi:phosphatidate phosphatase APP1